MAVSPARLPADELSDRLFAFEPDADRVRVLDHYMRHRLADSVRYILQQADGQIEFPRDDADAFLARLESGPISPLAFSYYSDAVMAIEDDDLDSAGMALAGLIGSPAAKDEMVVTELGDRATDAAARQFASFIDSDPTIRFDIFPPSAEAAASCRSQIRGALALLDAGDPALAAEIRALLRQVVLAAGTEDPKAYTFDGASSFMMWGAIILNANRRDGDLGMVQMLAHESAHNLLFGIGSDEPLVNNSADELFSSPLRVDPRPMDGIYHATFVTARMHRAVKTLIDSGVLPESSRQQAATDLADNARRFHNGYGTVKAHGNLSPLGQSVMDAAAAYMATAD